ncbi:Uncharacterized protein dnm_030670 [Desulfonema magnum]|uniref:Uncharacterized protein n=1 Tax=Desulfonema magnum TaxID=45655 RepID=A0A975BL01_9BACT|nr:Uncharacterized protein dnm_030670 [Desulfonema magnum]
MCFLSLACFRFRTKSDNKDSYDFTRTSALKSRCFNQVNQGSDN